MEASTRIVHGVVHGGLLAFTMALVAACASAPAADKERSLSSTGCVANQRLKCVCGLDEGVQVCDADGVLGVCQCNSDDAGVQPLPNDAPSVDPKDCGDGEVTGAETCDDGNVIDGDGCSSKCLVEDAITRGDVCPGQAVSIGTEAPLTLKGTTAGYTDNYRSGCVQATGPDRVYAVSPKKNGTLTIDFAPIGFNAVLYTKVDSCTALDAFCVKTETASTRKTLDVVVGKTYFIIVDGLTPSSGGDFGLSLRLQ
jgi:cysteine-rich repeat protein